MGNWKIENNRISYVLPDCKLKSSFDCAFNTQIHTCLFAVLSDTFYNSNNKVRSVQVTTSVCNVMHRASQASLVQVSLF